MKDIDSQNNMNSDVSQTGNDERTVIVWSVVTAILVVGLVYAVWKFAEAPHLEVADTQAQASNSADLQQVRRIEDSVLSSYQRLTSDTGAYCIPIQRAMELIASESNNSTR